MLFINGLSNFLLIIAIILSLISVLLLRKVDTLLRSKYKFIRFIARSKSVSNIILIGAILSLLGTVGNQYFSNKIEKIKPYIEPINSIEATLIINTAEYDKKGFHSISLMTFIDFISDNDTTILTLFGQGGDAYKTKSEGFEYRIKLNLEADDPVIDKAVRTISNTKNIKIYSYLIPYDKEILKGKFMIVVNKEIRFTINIPKGIKFLDDLENNNLYGKYIKLTDLKNAFEDFK